MIKLIFCFLATSLTALAGAPKQIATPAINHTAEVIALLCYQQCQRIDQECEKCAESVIDGTIFIPTKLEATEIERMLLNNRRSGKSGVGKAMAQEINSRLKK